MKSVMELVWRSVSLVIFTALGVAALSLAVKTAAEAVMVIRGAM